MKRPFRLPPLNRMLPMIVGLLCVGLFATTALILISPSFDPDSPQSADAGAISPHGFKGIYKLLDAQGYRSDINRRETGPQKRYDLEIITLENVDDVFFPLHRDYEANEADEPSREVTDNAPDNAPTLTEPTAAPDRKPSRSGPDDLLRAAKFPNPKKSDHILYNPQGGAVLIVMPKWVAKPHRTRPRWSQNEEPQPYVDLINLSRLLYQKVSAKGMTVTDSKNQKRSHWQFTPAGLAFLRSPTGLTRQITLMPASGQTLFTHPLFAGKIKGLQSVAADPKLTPILTGPKGEVLLARVNALPGEKPYAQPVYLLTDPDLLNNQILGDPHKVATALNLIEALRGKSSTPPSVVFDLTFNGHSVDKSLLHHIASPPFIAVPLCFMVLGLGLMWAAFARFGPAHDMLRAAPLGRGVSILADNAARLLAKAGREPKLAPLYAQMMRDAALKARGYMGHATLSSDELADQLSARIGTTETYSALARDAAKVTTPGHLISLCQRLHQWRLETGDVQTGAITSPLTTPKTES